MLYFSERHFKLWDYNVSHSQLLLRSLGSAEVGKNIDVVFAGVEFLQLPLTLRGLKLAQASAKETARVIGSLTRVGESCYIYSLRSGPRRYYVAASAFKVLENDLDPFESSLESVSAAEEGKELGKILVHS